MRHPEPRRPSVRRALAALAALGLSACAQLGGPTAQPPVPQPLDPAQCAARVAETETHLRAVESPEAELRILPWVAASLAEVRGRCPDLPGMDGVLLRLGNAAFFGGGFWTARHAYAELSARFPDSGFNFEDGGGRRARLIDACGNDVAGLDAYRLALLAARHGRLADARARIRPALSSGCAALRTAAREAAEAWPG